MASAASTYGTILRVGGPAFAEIVLETEIQEAIRLIEESEGERSGPANRQSRAQTPTPHASSQMINPTKDGKKPVEKDKILASHARIAGILILTQIAKQLPDMYYQHIELVLSRIMYPLRDPSRFLVVSGEPLLSFDGGFGGDSLGNIGSLLSTGKDEKKPGAGGGVLGDTKPAIEACDVVRRLAAALFGATLEVIKAREYARLERSSSLDSTQPGTVAAQAGMLDRSNTLSTMDPGIPGTPALGTGTAGSTYGGATGVHVSRPLVKVAIAASNDISNYIRSLQDGEKIPIRQRYLSTPTASSHLSSLSKPLPNQSQPQAGSRLGISRTDTTIPPGDVNRAFGALLLYRELFGSGLASLAGILAVDPDSTSLNDLTGGRHEERPSSLTRGGRRFVTSDGEQRTDHHRTSTSMSAHATHTKHEQSNRPLPYPTIFSDIFKLVIQFPTQPSSSTGLLAASTASLASLLAPASPTWSSPSPTNTFSSLGSGSTFVPSPWSSGVGTSGSLPSSGILGGVWGGVGDGVLGNEWGPYAGTRWNAPLPPLSKYELEEQLRKEALSLLPVCAAYDTSRFITGGWFRATMGVIMGAWGVEGYSDKSGRANSMSASSATRPLSGSFGGRPANMSKISEPSAVRLGDLDEDGFTEFGGGMDGMGKGAWEVGLGSKRGLIPVEKGDRSYLVRIMGELMYAMKSSKVSTLAYFCSFIIDKY
jgi:hypothetical protein